MRAKNWRGLALIIMAGLAGCGGGGAGSGSEDLEVSFGYDPVAYLWSETQLDPNGSGLEGNTPSCRVTSGRLPPGLRMGKGCAIVGVPEAIGQYTATIELTVSGHQGSVNVTQTFKVLGPPLKYPYFETENVYITERYSIPPGSDEPNFPEWQPADDVTVAYSLHSGELPEGLTINRRSGALQGVVGSAGLFAFRISVVASRNGVERRWISQEHQFRIRAVDVWYSPDIIYGKVGKPLLPLRPTVYSYGSLQGARYRYFLWAEPPEVSDRLPAGIELDPITGVISGTATSAESCDVNRGGKPAVGIGLAITRNGVTARSRVIVYCTLS